MSRALANAANCFGLVSISGAIVACASLALAGGPALYWLAGASLLPMGFLLAVLSARRTVALAAAFLLLGGICTFVYAATLMSSSDSFPHSNLFILSLPKLALVMVGGAGPGALVGVLWTTAGLTVAELATVAAVLFAGTEYRPDVVTLVTYLLLVTLLLFDGLTRRTARIAQAVIHRAAREDRALELRRELELRAAAHLHDTALSQLILIAEARPGPIDARLGAQINRDLSTLGDDDWLLGASHASNHRDAALRAVPDFTSADGSLSRQNSEIATAIDDAQVRGLEVQLSGDPGALSTLEPHIDRALGQALRQCLFNVLRHAGVNEVDVCVLAAPEELTLIVVDDGIGFDSAATFGATHLSPPAGGDGSRRAARSENGEQSLGLQNSVLHRIESLGGTVEVWSRVNVGTSVMMSVPIARTNGSAQHARGEEVPRA